MNLGQAAEVAAEVAERMAEASNVQEVLAVLVGILVLAVLALFWLYVRSLKDYATKVEALHREMFQVVVKLNDQLEELMGEEE